MGAPIVTEMLPQTGDAVRHRLVRDHHVAPYLGVQRVARNHLAGTRRQAHQHVHDLRFQAHFRLTADDAVLSRLDDVVTDSESGL